MLKLKVIAAASILVLSLPTSNSWAQTPHDNAITAPFDPKAFASPQEIGSATLTGQALARIRGGSVVTCAGLKVFLVPGNAYSDAVVKELHRQFMSFNYREFVMKKTFEDSKKDLSMVIKKLLPYEKTAYCDAQGNFEFDHLPAGKWDLFSDLWWSNSNDPNGGDESVVTGGASTVDGDVSRALLVYPWNGP